MNRKTARHVFLAAVLYLTCVSGLAAFAPWVTPTSYEEQNISEKLQTPSTHHWMGTDTLGRDLFSRVVYGARLSLAVGFMTAITALVMGIFVGSIAGYLGGWVDSLLMRLVDLLLIFPSVLMAILLMVIFGRGFLGLFLALAITSWLGLARLVRGQVLQAKTLTYVESARASGASNFAILFRHILPNLAGPIVVSLAIQVPNNIMAESFLSFVGLGLQPPFSSWGTLSYEGFRAMRSYPHLLIFPSAVLFVTLLAFNTLGESVKELLDVKNV